MGYPSVYAETEILRATEAGDSGAVALSGVSEPSPSVSFQFSVEGDGAVTADGALYGRVSDGHPWVQLATVSLDGTDTDTVVTSITTPYRAFRFNLTALTGVGAAFTCTAAY